MKKVDRDEVKMLSFVLVLMVLIIWALVSQISHAMSGHWVSDAVSVWHALCWMAPWTAWLAAGILAEGLFVFAFEEGEGTDQPETQMEGKYENPFVWAVVMNAIITSFAERLVGWLSLALCVLLGPYSLALALLTIIPDSFICEQKLGFRFIPRRQKARHFC